MSFKVTEIDTNRNRVAHSKHASATYTLSEIDVIISGVVQGSCLGPALFLPYINDLIDVFSDDVIVKLYADDVKLYSSCMIKGNDIDLEFQTKLNKLCKWANAWQLPISYMKCNVLEIGRPGFAQYRMNSWTVASVEKVVDLGVTIDNKLKFSSHINGIVSKAHKRANLIIRCFMSRYALINHDVDTATNCTCHIANLLLGTIILTIE